MLKGFTDEQLQEMADECQERFLKREKEIITSILTGEIGTYKRLICELEKLNFQYEDEMEDYTDMLAPDVIECVIEDFKRDEGNDKNLVLAAKDWLDGMSIVEKVINKKVYWNDDGLVSDEYGTPLNTDGEHRVFEVIKGGKD